jgi:hypothetical protein
MFGSLIGQLQSLRNIADGDQFRQQLIDALSSTLGQCQAALEMRAPLTVDFVAPAIEGVDPVNDPVSDPVGGGGASAELERAVAAAVTIINRNEGSVNNNGIVNNGLALMIGGPVFIDGGVVNQVNGANAVFVAGNVLLNNDLTVEGAFTASGGITFTDNNFLIQDNSDSSKKVTFEVSNISTSTTRTFTWPDSNGTVVIIADGVRQTFDPDATSAGINVGQFAGDPSTLINGDIWYNSSSNQTKFYINGSIAVGLFISGGVLDLSVVNIKTDTSTGTQIATATTQKIAFYGVTPVVQPSGALQQALANSTGGSVGTNLAAVSGSGDDGTINDNFTRIFDLLDAIRSALVMLGLIKGGS